MADVVKLPQSISLHKIFSYFPSGEMLPQVRCLWKLTTFFLRSSLHGPPCGWRTAVAVAVAVAVVAVVAVVVTDSPSSGSGGRGLLWMGRPVRPDTPQTHSHTVRSCRETRATGQVSHCTCAASAAA